MRVGVKLANMNHPGMDRWFHTLVVVGASLAGCGGVVEEPSPTVSGGGAASANAGRPSAETGGLSIKDCASSAQYLCQDYQAHVGCRCDPNAPLNKSACNGPFDFVCDDAPCESSTNDASPGALCVPTISGVGCRCDPRAPAPGRLRDA